MLAQSRKHLAAIHETYFQHQRFAFKYGLTCMKAGFMALIHGLVPAWFESKASETVKHLAGIERTNK